uniref:NADH dehydrogenase subunit 9 n=1 Tax=prasinophyte sp. MBIC10622 TaxID=156113 RepID=A0A650AKS2_9CHLO|nr:NADH dehydrogenase subunit 9 [prasinophyte sp. MBIC10622]
MNQAFAHTLIQAVPAWIQRSVLAKNELTLHVAVENLIPLLTYLKDHSGTQYKMLVEMCAVDYPARTQRFEVVYCFLSVRYNARIMVKVHVDEITPVDSSVSLYASAGWAEREIWDMHGVFFQGHPDLRRILTDYGFDGHPLRKDFPLSGYVEARYDDSEKRVVLEPLELTQEFRYFDFTSPWEQGEKSH